jgi:hypothetical protein
VFIQKRTDKHITSNIRPTRDRTSVRQLEEGADARHDALATRRGGVEWRRAERVSSGASGGWRRCTALVVVVVVDVNRCSNDNQRGRRNNDTVDRRSNNNRCIYQWRQLCNNRYNNVASRAMCRLSRRHRLRSNVAETTLLCSFNTDNNRNGNN